ncbi:phosphotransferase family protein [Mycolicibacterium hodleri]|uniref:phosphotransferase family protein n=1 Tax=Mycolicibacterium hodleri TaxID=49897 RepID=UPI001F37CBA7|nr:phosphotransferase family protein [Mycolicibacterium hodleri]
MSACRRQCAGSLRHEREWRILIALEGTDVPHPTPLVLGSGSDTPTGGSFLIMGRVDGFTPVGILAAPYDQASARRDLAFAMVDAVASLGNVDWRARGLDGLGKPDGFLERQVARWNGQIEGYRTRDIPGLDTLSNWLETSRPTEYGVGLMHGDYSPFNVMASPQVTTRLAAVIDWDTGTVGDPIMDIAHLLARWTEPGEVPAIGQWDIGDGIPAHRAGLPTRAEMAKSFEERSGRDLRSLPYYQALALFKLAAILEGRTARAHQAGDEAARHDWAAMVDRVIDYANKFATGERV